MSKATFSRSCPVCNSKVNETICPIDFELFDGHPMNGGYNVVQCNDCGFIFANTSVTQEQLDKYYTELSKYEDKISTGGGFTENDKKRLIDVAAFVDKNIGNKDLRILDLGCANGGLLKELQNRGFTNLVGIDPSLICVDITKAEVGCDCFQYSIFDVPDTVGKFDLIILSHVLEHVLNVNETVKIIFDLLNADGYLYLECPNAEHYQDVIHAPFQEFNTEHINHFTKTSFKNIAGENRFEEIYSEDKIFKIASDQEYHAVYGLFHKNPSYIPKIQFDVLVRPAIQEYIDKSSIIFNEIKKTLDAIPKETTIALFGIGQFAFKLLKTAAFENRKYKLFDNSAVTVGKKIQGKTIKAGSEILNEYKQEQFTIVISSLIHETPIKNRLQNLFESSGEKAPSIIGFSHLI